jgi:hypothetical protein
MNLVMTAFIFNALVIGMTPAYLKGLRSAGGRLLSRSHAARTGIGSKRIDEEIIHGLTATDV